MGNRKAKRHLKKGPTRLEVLEEKAKQASTLIQALYEHNKSLWDAFHSSAIQSDRFNRMVDAQGSLFSMLGKIEERMNKLEAPKKK